ncbi:MAG TPA: hypothetical protein V6D08_01400 [Candidatus Obscuribacterales bacterium]
MLAAVKCNTINGIVSVAPGGNVDVSGSVTVNACTVVDPNALNGGAFALIVSPDCSQIRTGGGTIVNTDGDVVLSKDPVISSNGLDVAIIASGNISSQQKLKLNLSSKTGNGGVGGAVRSAIPGRCATSGPPPILSSANFALVGYTRSSQCWLHKASRFRASRRF